MMRARAAWIAATVEADLPYPVRQRVPDWASTGRGRVLLAVGTVIALLAWAVIFMLIATV